MTNDDDTLSDLSPGIRNLVLAMREAGFKTVDSGDGTNYENGMACAVPFKMVACVVPQEQAFAEADRLHSFMKEYEPGWVWQVDLSYNPGDRVCMLVVAEQDTDMIQELTGRFIVKVQASLNHGDNPQTLLIYNQDRSLLIEQEATPELLAALPVEKNLKAYFWATLMDGELRIEPEDQANWQDW